MLEMRTILTTNEPSSRALPLRSWRMHAWEGDAGTPERVAGLLHAHGSAVGVLWFQPPYYDLDAGSNAAGVYRGCGRDDAARAKSKKTLRCQGGVARRRVLRLPVLRRPDACAGAGAGQPRRGHRPTALDSF
jgi:hypothetical protein